MISPVLFASVPFGNPTAFSDAIGSLELYVNALADAIHDLTDESITTLPIGIGGTRPWLLAVQAVYQDAARALSIPPPANLASFTLEDRQSFNGFWFTVSQETERLRDAAGLS